MPQSEVNSLRVNTFPEDMEEETVDENSSLLPNHQHHLDNLDVDKLLVERVGEFGKYQKFIYVLVCLPAALTAGITLGSVFTEFVPVHRCFVPGCDDELIPHYDDAYYLNFSNFTLPTNQSCCYSFERIKNDTHCTKDEFSQNLLQKCDRHVFKEDVMKSSLVTEFQLVCDKEWEVPLSQSTFFAGVLVGAITFGWLSDLWGRKKTFMVGLMMTVTFGSVAAASTSQLMFTVLQFFTAMGQVGLFQTTFVIAVELVGPSKRVFCGIAIEYFFVLGELYLALVSWYFRKWRYIQLANVLPGVLFFSYYFIMPESIRWLLTKKKYNKAHDILQKLATRNNVTLPSNEEMHMFKKQEEIVSDDQDESMFDLLKRPRMICRLLNVFLSWFCITLIYYGISMNASSLAGDVYLNFALLSICEVPGYTLSYIGMKWVGRRFSLSSSLLIGGIGCLASSLTTGTLSTIFFLTGKFGATAAFGTVYLYTGELFPTKVRSICVGMSSMMGRFGAIISPYIVLMGTVTDANWLPMLVFAGAGILAGLLTLLLPETKNTALPRSLNEAENIGRR